MRRLTSIIAAVAIAATGLTLSSSVASAAGGTAKTIRSTTTSPAAVPNASALRMERLEKSNTFLVVGRNTSVAGSNLHVWKMKEDLTFDNSFGAKDLGTDFSAPTSSNSVCASTNGTNCARLENFSVNENADTFSVVYVRQLKGSGTNSMADADVISVLTGKISTGAIIAQAKYLATNSGRQLTATNWSSYSTTDLATSVCNEAHGATINSSPLNYSWAMFWESFIRSDGAIVYSIDCQYSNIQNLSGPSAIKEYSSSIISVLKPSGNTFVKDTTFGTNGIVKLNNALTECGHSMVSSSSDNSVNSLTSTKTLFVAQNTSWPRTTTTPNYLQGNNNISSFDGCDNNPGNAATENISTFQANGKVKKTVSYPTGKNFFAMRWVIDSQGRWNAVATVRPIGGAPSPTQANAPVLIRLLPDGSLDATLGTTGMKELTGLPSTVTVNGTSITMYYSVDGLASTANTTYFTGFASSGFSNCGTQSGSYTSKIYPYYFSIETGLVTSYGTNGLGEASVTEISNAGTCGGESLGGAAFINSEGRPATVLQVAAIGSQAAGLVYTVWDAADGVISGGDGTSSSGGGRTDTKVYSKSLPAKTQEDTALQILTKKQAKDLDLRSTTPKVCVALTDSVLMVNTGKCTVQVIDEDTKQVLRTMRTTVTKTDQEVGSTLTTDDPIKFKQASTKLSKTALAQITELAGAAGAAKKVVIIGHSASLYEDSKFSYAISRDRANAVRAALVKAGVKASVIETVALSTNQPLTTKKTEAAQEKNRRVEVFILE